MADQPRNELAEIRIDRDGVWYYRNVEMKRTDIVQYFYQHIHRDSKGNYRIELNHERCSIYVEDVPYVIRCVSSGSTMVDGSVEAMNILLSDGCTEKLDPETIWMGERDVLYCRVKRREHEARFSRQAYYQLAEYIEYDPNYDRYFMTIGGRSYTITVSRTTEKGEPYAG